MVCCIMFLINFVPLLRKFYYIDETTKDNQINH